MDTRYRLTVSMRHWMLGLALLIGVGLGMQHYEARADEGGECNKQPPAYSVVKVAIKPGGLDGFRHYVEGHLPSVAKFGGNFRAATLGAPIQPEVIEKAHGSVLSHFNPGIPEIMVIHQWPCTKAFHKWYGSKDYAPWKELRHSVSVAQLILIEGLQPADLAEHWPPAYSVVDVDVSARDVFFGKYVPGHQGAVEKFGGKFLVAGGKVETIEGSWAPRLVVMHRFPSIHLWKEWYDSPDYAPWKTLRHGSAKADVMLIEGLTESFKRSRAIP